MEEKNQPRRPRRSPEENTQKNESLVYGKNPVTELLKSGSGVDQAGASQQAAPDDRHREPSGCGCICQRDRVCDGG